MATMYLDMDYSDQFEFELVGLSSREKDFRLAWFLNRTMGWHLERLGDIEVRQREEVSFHSRFGYCREEDLFTVTLLMNRTPEGLLIPEWGQFDFLLKVEDAVNEIDDAFLRKLRTAGRVLAAFPIATGKLKSRNNLIFS